MNWSRAKTILIFMFLATAIFQSFVLYNSERKTKNISPEIITACTELLDKNQISVKTEIIPKRNYSLPYIEADNAISDYQEFAKLVLGQDAKKTEENTYSSPSGTVTFSGNSFNIIASGLPTAIKNELSAVSKSKELLDSLGFDLNSAKETVKKNANGFDITYSSHIGDTPVADSTITVSIQNSEIKSISGKWFNITEKYGSVKLKSITSVLIDLIKADIEKPAKITEISLGYIIPENNSYQKSASLVPVWRLSFENGQTLSIDARNPQ